MNQARLLPAINKGYLGSVIAFFLKANRTQVLLATGLAIALIAIADWAVGARASLGLLYIIPMAMGATVVAPWQTAGLALVCSALRAWFDLPHPQPLELLLRSLFAFLAYTGFGLAVSAVDVCIPLTVWFRLAELPAQLELPL